MYRRIEVPGSYYPTMILAGSAMCSTGLPAVGSKQLKWERMLKFFFTEFGWKRCGHAVLSEIRFQGYRAKVIVVKEKDSRLNIYYRDKWQVALLFGGK